MTRRILSILLCCSLVSCGTQDYDTAETPNIASSPATTRTSSTTDPRQTSATATAPTYEKPLLKTPYHPGYLWMGLRWVGVSDDAVTRLKCTLRDSQNVNHFSAFGSTLLWGGILGIVIHASGGWLFGRPADAPSGHWFWNNFDHSVKTGFQGFARGAIFAGACDTLLAGGNLTPFAGVLGHEHAAASAAISLATMSSMAASPFVQKWLRETQARAATGNASDRPSGNLDVGRRDFKAAISNIRDWTRSSEIGRAIRYKVAPGVLIIGIGAGVGVIVHDWLQGAPTAIPVADADDRCIEAGAPSNENIPAEQGYIP